VRIWDHEKKSTDGWLDDLKPQLLEMGICEVLIPLTNSPSVEVQGNSAAALGNLSSKGQLESSILPWSKLMPSLQLLRITLLSMRYGTSLMAVYMPTLCDSLAVRT
jgi:hypothetical protein